MVLMIGEKHCIKKIEESMSSSGDFRDVKHRTIFHDLLDSTVLPPEDKTVGRLWQEAQLLLSAGTVTTATSIGSALVYLLLDPRRMQILLEELETAMPDITNPKRQTELEKLPYLVSNDHEPRAEIEVLTLYRPPSCKKLCGSSQESHTVSRAPPRQKHCKLVTGPFHQTYAPSNLFASQTNLSVFQTAISMHHPLIHHSPTFYPEPWSFIPERWLPSTPATSSLPSRPANIPPANPKYLFPFSKGSRHCLGQPLAHAEIYMTLANVLRTFCRLERNEFGEVTSVRGMKLYETDRRDVDMKCDMGFPSPEKGRGNIRVALE